MASAFATFNRLFLEVEAQPRPSDWRAKWQRACECLWEALGAGVTLDEKLVDRFFAKLLDRDMFSLARLAIPALRLHEPDTMLYGQQQRILDATVAIRDETWAMLGKKQSDFDDGLYAAEKRVMLDAQLHRAKVLLHQSEAFGSATEEDIEQWLKKAPGVEEA